MSDSSPISVSLSEESGEEKRRRLVRRFTQDFSLAGDTGLFFVEGSGGF